MGTEKITVILNQINLKRSLLMKKCIVLFLLLSKVSFAAMGYNYEMHDVNNPYPKIAQMTEDQEIIKAINNAQNDGWLINSDKSVTYEQTNCLAIAYCYTRPLGQAIAWGNKRMLRALLDLGANIHDHVYKEGARILVPEALQPFRYKYNAFEYAINCNKPKLAKIIYDKDETIID